jgi:predicted metal-dependent hydrolase
MSSPIPPPEPLKYLPGLHERAPELAAQVQALLAQRRLGEHIAARYPEAHTVRSDRALQGYVAALKSRHLKTAEPLSKVVFDNHLHVVHQALGTHTTVARVQGSRLKTKRELRVASVFQHAPAALLEMIVVHELAHLKERQHDKAFYALCRHMLPDYHQREFDTRLWLTARELERA